MNSPRDTLQELWRRCRYLASRFIQDKCPENAAALTYMSLFALVPLLTALFTIASAVPAFQGMEEQVQDFLFENLMPEKNDEIQQYLSDFSRQAKNLTGPGIVKSVLGEDVTADDLGGPGGHPGQDQQCHHHQQLESTYPLPPLLPVIPSQDEGDEEEGEPLGLA